MSSQVDSKEYQMASEKVRVVANLTQEQFETLCRLSDETGFNRSAVIALAVMSYAELQDEKRAAKAALK